MFPLCFCFCILFSFYCLSLFPHWSPRRNVHILARQDLPLLEYTVEFSQLDVLTAFNNAALNSLFWIGENYHRPIKLPDTTRLSWREAIIRCLESVYPWFRAQPDPESKPTDDGEPNGATVLRIATEPELQVSLDQMRELATVPAMREKAMDSASVERDSAHCTMGEGELTVDLGLWNVEGEFMDLYANLPPLLPPSLKPSVSPVPTSSPERAAIPTSGPERAPYPKSNPEMAPISLSSPKSVLFPSEGTCSRIRPWEGSCSWIRPWEGSRDRVQPHEGSFPRVLNKEGFHSCLTQRRPPFPRSAQRGLLLQIAALRAHRLKNVHPPSRSCLLHRCCLAAPLLTLNPPSVQCEHHGSASLHCRHCCELCSSKV